MLNQIEHNGGDDMKTLEIFEKVNLVTPIEQRRFFNYLEDSINELRLLYGNAIYYIGYKRLRDKPEDWEENYRNYYELQSNGFVPVLSADYVNNKRYEKTDEKDPLINIPPPRHLDDDIVVNMLFHDCIVDNILYLAGAGETYKSEFIRKANLANLQNWNMLHKGGRIRRMRW